jgi:hypothetical protein
MKVIKVESAGQPQRDRDLDELWVNVSDHIWDEDALGQLAKVLAWAQMGQVVRVTIDGR